MDKRERLDAIRSDLETATRPLNGTELAARFGVSRQAIVQDMAALRNEGIPVAATSQGYLLDRGRSGVRRLFAVRHGAEAIHDELRAVVDAGGTVADVIVDHPVYGEIRGAIGVRTRDDVTRFVTLLESSGRGALLTLSGGFHLHTVEAPDEATMSRVEEALRTLGILLRP
jgi:transcriptional regulator of NAD metabolism